MTTSKRDFLKFLGFGAAAPVVAKFSEAEALLPKVELPAPLPLPPITDSIHTYNFGFVASNIPLNFEEAGRLARIIRQDLINEGLIFEEEKKDV